MPPGILSTPGVFKHIKEVKPLSIPSSAFIPQTPSDWLIDQDYFRNSAATTLQVFYAPVFLPEGANITRLVMYAYRNGATPILTLNLYRAGVTWPTTLMATVTADWTGGEGSLGTDVITEPIVENMNYYYSLAFHVDPNGGPAIDARGMGARIQWA